MVGGGGIINDEICFVVNSVVTPEFGVGGGTIMVARNESKSKLMILSLFRHFDKTVSAITNLLFNFYTKLLTPKHKCG